MSSNRDGQRTSQAQTEQQIFNEHQLFLKVVHNKYQNSASAVNCVCVRFPLNLATACNTTLKLCMRDLMFLLIVESIRVGLDALDAYSLQGQITMDIGVYIHYTDVGANAPE